MSERDYLSGFIEEFSTPGFEPEAMRSANDAVITALPEIDNEYPPMVRSMFSVPRDPRARFRQTRIIGIAVHQNGLIYRLDRWLQKFEDVLSRLRWARAVIHLEMEVHGRHTLEYRVDDAAMVAMRAGASATGTSWELRCFRREERQEAGLEQVTSRPGFTATPRFANVSMPKRYASIDDARQDPDAVFVLDINGYAALTCPLRHIAASLDRLSCLGSDLERMWWRVGFTTNHERPSFDALIAFQRFAIGAAVERDGQVVDGMWLNQRLSQHGIGEQVKAVLSGEQDRLQLPDGFPVENLTTVEEARNFKTGYVRIDSGVRDKWLLIAPASAVLIERPELVRLGQYLDGVLRVPIVGRREPPCEPSVTIRRHPKGDEPPWHATTSVISPLMHRYDEILSMLSGDHPIPESSVSSGQ
jgi:hypothetical protein